MSPLALFFLYACGPVGPAPASPARETPAHLQPAIDAIEAALPDTDVTALSVAVLEGGEIVFAHAWGSARPDSSVPVDTETLFLIGSTSKSLTAALALLAVERGALSLDAPLSTLAPDLVFEQVPGLEDALDLRLLLSHQSGLSDAYPDQDAGPDELEDFVINTMGPTWTTLAPPGAFWNYSNPNFGLAAFLTQRAEGRVWSEALETGLLEPLAMTRTLASKADVAIDDHYAIGRAGSRALDVAHLIDLDEVAGHPFSTPLGYLWSTPSDLLRFASALLGHRPDVLSDGLLAEMTHPQVCDTFPGYLDGWPGSACWGLGLGLADAAVLEQARYDTPVWEHGGGVPPWYSVLVLLPGEDVAVSVLWTGQDAAPYPMAHALLAAAAGLSGGPDWSWPDVDPEVLLPYSGSYQNADMGSILLDVNDAGLRVTWPALDAQATSYDPALVHLETRHGYLDTGIGPVPLSVMPAVAGAGPWIRTRSWVATRIDGGR